MTVLVVQLTGFVVLFICSAFFSAAETALISLNPAHIDRIRKDRPRAADLIEYILSAPSDFLSTILIGNTLVNVALASIGYTIAEHFFPYRGEAISIPLMTFLLLLFGEVTPKRLAMSRAGKLAVVLAPIVTMLIFVMAPLRVVLNWLVSFLKKDIPAPVRKALSEDEFLTVVKVGEEEGVLDKEERAMVDGIIGLQKTQAKQAMTPRVDLVGIDTDDPEADWEKIAMDSHFRYLPVYRRSLDHAHGFLDVPRFLFSPDHDLEDAMIKPFFVPEAAPLDNVLATFQKENIHVAFVVDEFGGTAGLITRGDILEEIVGDVENETRPERLTIQKIAESRWIVDGSTSLDDINYEIGSHLEAENVDRISGWISAQTGHIPRTGEIVDAQGCRVTVHRTKRNRVVTVFVEKLAAQPETSGGATAT
jgi:putative hemolysin